MSAVPPRSLRPFAFDRFDCPVDVLARCFERNELLARLDEHPIGVHVCFPDGDQGFNRALSRSVARNFGFVALSFATPQYMMRALSLRSNGLQNSRQSKMIEAICGVCVARRVRVCT